MAKKAIIIGASGLIGSELLSVLLHEPAYTEVITLVRKSLNTYHPKLKEIITDFSNLSEIKEHIKADVIFSCIGTTRAKTPDLSNYRKIDHDIPIEIGKIAVENQVKQYHLVSALGANAQSSNFYSKIKGETEDDLKALNIPAIHIYQPSLLRGERKEKRVGEKIALVLMQAIDPLLVGSLKKYRSIKTSVIALAMYQQSLKEDQGIFTYPSDIIKEIV
ncbi:NAD(P)H-binding protein [Pedobacter aquae]|uniref:NAD(P)H-binding protein n=1 Tax=Pedobacter aquae TaxID=2605747 RepID=A0A5C0VMQ7_9SPHI|nr:NAD(P)H-binding protein [Pedobacter aquae]QEK52560.1 NAD(P)H-binding protein [Pedobacter aquae]